MKLHTSLLALTATFALCACDSKQEQAREKSLENRADSLDEQAKIAKKAADDKADAVKRDADLRAEALKKDAEAKADALKKEAEITREKK